MITYMIYILKVSFIFTILYSFYLLFFRQLSFFNLNRLLLLLLPIVSFLIPLIEINLASTITLKTELMPFDNFVSDLNAARIYTMKENSQFKYIQFIQITYLLGIIIYTFRLFNTILKTFILKNNSEQTPRTDCKLHKSNINKVFTFFNYIFIPRELHINKLETIITHEKAHVKLKHTYDLIFSEVIIVVFWFNPMAYFYKKSLKAIHEYQADKIVLNSNISKLNYINLLLEPFNTGSTSELSCYFNEITLKKRIEMIVKGSSPNLKKLKYILFVPVILLLIFLISDSAVNFQGNSLKINKLTSVKKNIPSIKPIEDKYSPRISSAYGMRIHPVDKVHKMHYAVDISAKFGVPIIATADGTVILKEFKPEGYGRVVIVKHNETYSSLYSQMSAFNVEKGQAVKVGDVIGFVGSSGLSTGPHLHYEVRRNGERVDPEDYFQ